MYQVWKRRIEQYSSVWMALPTFELFVTKRDRSWKYIKENQRLFAHSLAGSFSFSFSTAGVAARTAFKNGSAHSENTFERPCLFPIRFQAGLGL